MAEFPKIALEYIRRLKPGKKATNVYPINLPVAELAINDIKIEPLYSAKNEYRTGAVVTFTILGPVYQNIKFQGAFPLVIALSPDSKILGVDTMVDSAGCAEFANLIAASGLNARDDDVIEKLIDQRVMAKISGFSRYGNGDCHEVSDFRPVIALDRGAA